MKREYGITPEWIFAKIAEVMILLLIVAMYCGLSWMWGTLIAKELIK